MAFGMRGKLYQPMFLWILLHWSLCQAPEGWQLLKKMGNGKNGKQTAFIQYSAFIQSALQFMPLIHPFTHTFTHQRRLAAMQGTNQLIRSNWGLGVQLRDTSTRPGWDRTGNPPTARRQFLPPELYRPQILKKVEKDCERNGIVAYSDPAHMTLTYPQDCASTIYPLKPGYT